MEASGARSPPHGSTGRDRSARSSQTGLSGCRFASNGPAKLFQRLALWLGDSKQSQISCGAGFGGNNISRWRSDAGVLCSLGSSKKRVVWNVSETPETRSG